MKIKTALLTGIVCASSSYFLYKTFLREDAKNSLKQTVKCINNAYISIKKNIDDHYGIVIEGNNSLNNVSKTQREWKSLGY